jgi:CRISPR type III-A-associated RAMP protein Csm5
MTTTAYRLTCLSPVHIGTGTQFSKFDSVYEDKQWSLVDLDNVLTHGVDANALAHSMSERHFAWVAWLRTHGMQPSAAAAYTLPCPQDPEDTPIREAIKDAQQGPLIPGSSIKGALRTTTLWRLIQNHSPHQTFVGQYLALCQHAQDLSAKFNERRAFDKANLQREILTQTLGLAEEQGRSLQQTLYRVLDIREERLSEPRTWRDFQRRLQSLGRNREWLSQSVERVVLGRNPNHDLMRAVQVSDSAPGRIAQLAVGLVWTYTLRGNQLVEKRDQNSEYKAFAEWLVPGTTLQLTIKLDEFLFTDAANRDLRFRGPKEQAIRQLARTCSDYAGAIISTEKTFYATYGLNTLHDFYEDLEAIHNTLPAGAFLLNIGWGGGWEVKTLGDILQTALGDNGFRQLRQRYRLGATPRTGQLHLDTPFPKTRRVAYDNGAPRWPLGWIKLQPLEE